MYACTKRGANRLDENKIYWFFFPSIRQSIITTYEYIRASETMRFGRVGGKGGETRSKPYELLRRDDCERLETDQGS